MDRGQTNGYRRLRRALVAPFLAALVLLASAAAAEASTIVVNVTNDPTGPGACLNGGQCSLRQAIAAANSGDIIQLPAGNYGLTLGADLDISKSLTIVGDTTADTTIDGSHNNADGSMGTARILRVDSAASVTIQNVTLTGGLDGQDETCPNGCSPSLVASGGGALFNSGGDVTLDDVAFTGNVSSGPLGGAVSNGSGTLTMNDVSFTDDAGYIGGALFARGGTVTGDGVTFYNDAPSATDNAAVYLYGGTVSFTNTTIADNGGASSRGGGIDNGGATLTLINDTLSGNVRGSLLTDQGASTTVENTIIGAGFSDGVDFACIAPGYTDDINDRTTANAVTMDSGDNIDQDGHCDLTKPSDISGEDTKLVPIANNGGPTPTQALIAGSPALGDPASSDCPPTDQRGQQRPEGKCDIGAFEAVLHGPPDATTGDATNVTDSSVDLAATINLDGEAGGFHFVYGTSPDDLTSSSPVAAAGVVSSDTPETETLSGLTPGTTYYYAAAADNATASTLASTVEQFTTDPGPPVISNVNVDSVTDTTAKLEFSVDPQGADTTYFVEYGPDTNYSQDGQQTQPVDIGSTTGAQDRSVTLTGLNPASSYDFQVVASNSVQQNVGSGDNQFSTDQQVTGTDGNQVTVTDSGITDGSCPLAADTIVDWGDGSSDTNGQIQCGEGGDDETEYTLTDTHTYASTGDYPIQIEYGDLGSVTDEYAEISSGSPPPSSPPASSPSRPAVTTTAPTVSITSAGFSGSVAPDGLPTQAFFEYGLDPKYSGGGPIVYGQTTQPQSVGSDFASHAVGPVAVSGLIPNAVYHVRLVATNSAGTTVGPDVTFTTEAAPAPNAPTVGKTFNVSPVSGFVLIKIDGKFVPLTGLEQIPSGSQIDARHGSLELITSNGNRGKTQHGTFGGAIFKLTQERSGPGKGLVTLALVEGAFKGAPSYALCTKHKAGDASASAVSSRVLQLLRASAHGKFRTRGRYSAATVRGTIWTVSDRCDGTFTHDVTDSVAVNDFVHHKTIILHAGQSYLASRPRP